MNRWFLDEARKGNVYHSHTTTVKAVTAIHATHTGITIENPMGSAKDLVIESFSFTGSTLANDSELGIGCGPGFSMINATSTTACVIHNAKLAGGGFNTGIAVSHQIDTLPNTPVWLHPLASLRITGAVEGSQEMTKKFDGTLIVPPGMYACLMALTVVRTGLCSATWAEVDVLTEAEKALI